MPAAESDLTLLRIPRLAALATSACPAWLWSTDASRLAWANAAAAAIFGMAHAARWGELRVASDSPVALQIPRLAATLPSGGQPRLERLRGFGGSLGRLLTCACARIVMPDGQPAVLVAATEPAGPALSLPDRVGRLVAGSQEAIAAFAPDGALMHANATAQSYLGGAVSLSALGLQWPATLPLEGDHATAVVHLGEADFDATQILLGADATRVLLLSLSPTALKRAPPRSDSLVAAAAVNSQRANGSAPVSPEEPVSEHRHPLRFVWHMDSAERFVIGSDEFVDLVGPQVVAACGRPWSEIASELKLDPEGQVSRAIASRETWSGVPILWPVDEASERLPIELSGLPLFDRDHVFRGYRGFGVCRDIGRLNRLARHRQTRPIGFSQASAPMSGEGGEAMPPADASLAMALETEGGPPPDETARPQQEADAQPSADTPATDNVVPFRAGAASEARAPSLSPIERNAFRELAQELTARLRGPQDEPGVGEEEHRAVHQPHAAPGAVAASAAQIAAVAAEAQNPEPLPPRGALILLDRVPAAVLVYRNEALLYANRALLDLSGYDDLAALATAGGLAILFADPPAGAPNESAATQTLSVKTRTGSRLPVEGRLFTVPWGGASALALILSRSAAEAHPPAAGAPPDTAQKEIGELKSDIDRVTRREAQKAAAAKADFLAKVSHEIRTPLNSMIGFAEVILAERFGSIGNDRYREYLRDIHLAGTHLVSMLNDLVDLSKIETGQFELAFADVNLNELTQQCVGVMQPQANRARIIIRTALAPGVPHVSADERSLRQIVINLLAHAIHLTGPGGQVIVSSATTDAGEVLLRVRDTGAGMRETDIQAALEPFAQTASASWSAGGNGLRLPLTKALAEANRARFLAKSSPNAGTLVEIAFPRSTAGSR